MHINRLAKELAIEAKLHNAHADDDFGFLYPEEYALTDAEWKAVCAEIARLLPSVQPTRDQYVAHSAAMRGYSSNDPICSDA